MRFLYRLSTVVPACGFFLSAAAAVQAQGTPAKPANAPPAAAAHEPTAYRIGAGDVIQLFVWKEPELTRELAVRIDGKVTIPLLGDVTAAGRTGAELAEDVSTQLKRYLAAPQVTIGISQAYGARIFVLGQVQRPGEFPLRGRTTLIQALAMAGGFKEFAKTSDIVIVRQDDSGETFLRADYKKLESARDASQNLTLLSGDTVLVP
jgi:polysaccharide export outer membrane protein